MTRVKARLDIITEPPILVADELCDLCGGCVGVCPPDVIVMTERTLLIAEGCIKCGLCIPVCPLGALSWNESGAAESGGDSRTIKVA
jgi:ferredoxin